MGKIDPFSDEIVELRKPLISGERIVKTLTFKPPTVKDLLAAGQYTEASIPFTFALLCSLCGEAPIIIQTMAPEDWADCMVIVNRSYQRFCGTINLFDQKENGENPQTADTLSGTSLMTSAESPAS